MVHIADVKERIIYIFLSLLHCRIDRHCETPTRITSMLEYLNQQHIDEESTLKRLKDLLYEISPLKLSEQYQILESSFETWKGNEEQVDDVTILGIKL